MTLRQYIKQTYKKGDFFSFSDLPKKLRKGSSIVQLSRFAKEGFITKAQKGQYRLTDNKENGMTTTKHIVEKRNLYFTLQKRGYFWSGSIANPVSFNEQDDNTLIHKALLYLDPEEKELLFSAYPKRKVKRYWINNLLKNPARYNTANWIIATFFFDIKDFNKYTARYGKAQTESSLN